VRSCPIGFNILDSPVVCRTLDNAVRIRIIAKSNSIIRIGLGNPERIARAGLDLITILANIDIM
jgi:hypothetical protein